MKNKAKKSDVKVRAFVTLLVEVMIVGGEMAEFGGLCRLRALGNRSMTM